MPTASTSQHWQDVSRALAPHGSAITGMERVRQSLEGRTISVTGAGGFIGSALVRTLAAWGANVQALVAAPDQPFVQPPDGVRALCAHIEDVRALRRLVAGSETVVHLAGPPSVRRSFEDPFEYARVHIQGTLAVLEACRLMGVARLVYLSSAEVYGRPRVSPVAEHDATRPRSPYAAAKAAAEQFVEAYVHAQALTAVVLRPFSVYGPGSPGDSLMGTILKQLRTRDEIVLADLQPIRDYVYIDDVVNGIARAACVQCTGISTFNLGSGIGTSVGDLARLTVRQAGCAHGVRADVSGRQRGSAEIGHLIADTARAQCALGWRSEVPLASGVLNTLRWMEAPRQ